ncbi:MFS transporter [Pseudalkalibacillus sp. Hm43]|uniref:MFS transporter n=1 Tax=Pseudalkalibacillus sp. Hm43 TaxID=3450742 RepID=UPI003F43E565
MFNEIWTNNNLRRYFTGRFISSLGNHFSFFAQSVAAYHFTETLTAVGVLWLVRGIASILLIPFGGVLADRFPRKRLMLTTDVILGLLTFCFIFVDHGNQVWLLPLLAFSTQAVQRVYDPAAKASFKSISDPTPLKISGSVSALLSQIAVIAGPLLAGILYFNTNESLQLLFVLDAITFLISFFFLLQVDFKDSERQQNVPGRPLLLEGFQFIFRTRASVHYSC